MPVYSVVIPLYNEEAALPELRRRLVAVLDELDGDSEVVLVDDGSSDRTFELADAIADEDPRFRIVELSRNFGHQVAISAGIDFAQGDAVITMDGDLQHPPETIPELVRCWREGFEIVYAARENRSRESWFKRVAAHWFYRLLGRIASVPVIAHVADFRLIDRKAADAFRSLPERVRYLRGMFSWVGFRHTIVPYRSPERFGGEAKYTTRRLVSLAVSGIIGFSDAPLRLALAAGFVVSGISFLFGMFAIVMRLIGYWAVPGWASLLVSLSFLGGVQLIMLGMIGIYVGRIFEEVKQRPVYVVRQVRGFVPRPAPAVERERSGADV
jgi:glycosyltransferase involved in cell wall biosynthesis